MDWNRLHETILPLIQAMFAKHRWPHPGIILDVGCGDQTKWPLIHAALSPDQQLVGVDIQRFPTTSGHSLVVADAHQLPFRAQSLAGMSCIATLGLLAQPNIALQEAYRTLQPHAPLLIITAEQRWCMIHHWPEPLFAQICLSLQQYYPHPLHHLPASSPDLVGEVTTLLTNAGFQPTAWAMLYGEHDPWRATVPLISWELLRIWLSPWWDQAMLSAYDTAAPEAEVEVCSLVVLAHANKLD